MNSAETVCFSVLVWEISLPDQKYINTKVIKVDDSLGIVYGFAIICKENGQDYVDLQGDHIPENSMTKAAADFMINSRKSRTMHEEEDTGDIVFAFPLTSDIASAFGITTNKTGLMIGMKPNDPEILKGYKDGKYTGFSIGGERVKDEVIHHAA